MGDGRIISLEVDVVVVLLNVSIVLGIIHRSKETVIYVVDVVVAKSEDLGHLV